jgi:anti-sigma B factor antagonist
MNFLLEEIDDVKILRIKEERLDSNVAPDLKAQLLMLVNDKSKVVVELSHVKYADSSGLGALLLGLRQARDNGGHFTVCGAQKRVKSLLKIAQLDGMLKNYENEIQAIEHMK